MHKEHVVRTLAALKSVNLSMVKGCADPTGEAQTNSSRQSLRSCLVLTFTLSAISSSTCCVNVPAGAVSPTRTLGFTICKGDRMMSPLQLS